MKDGFGRTTDYLRISLTDKCNLRCTYCMPEEGIRGLKHEEILSLEETAFLAGIFNSLGIRRIRLTGGEPLVRKNAVWLVNKLSNSCDLDELCMTTNAALLRENAKALKAAGLDSLNVSLDTLSEKTFKEITGQEGLPEVLQGIEEAKKQGFKVKLNCVLLKGVNDTEVEELVRFADRNMVDIRFIELMPIGCGAGLCGISNDDLLESLEKCFGKADKNIQHGDRGPALYYSFPSLGSRIGLISPMSHKFCDKCNRLRLTADGFLKLCLQYSDGVDLKRPLRNGAGEEELKSLIREAVLKKPACHSFFENSSQKDNRKMIQIGG